MKRTLITTTQAAEYLGFKVNTLEGWRVKGLHLPFYRIGNIVRYAKEDLDAYIDPEYVRPKDESEEILLTTRQAGRYLGEIPAVTLRHWRMIESVLPYIKIGVNIRYSTKDLDKFLDDNKHTQTTPTKRKADE
jgi:excisionase family DNA binding protein